MAVVRIGYLVVVLLILAALGVSIAAMLRAEESVVIDGPWSRPLEERRKDPFPRSFPVRPGVEIEIPAAPQRIVAGSVLTAEVLLAAGAADRIAAIHRTAMDLRYSAVADEVRSFPRHTTGDPEDILSHEPDLVLTDSFTKAETQMLLEAAGVTVLRTATFNSLADLQNNMRAIGYATGLDSEVEALIQTMQAELEEVAAGNERRRGWRVLDLNAAMYTSGKGSTLDDLLKYVGARNVATENAVGEYLRVDVEQVLGWDPDVLIVPAAAEEQDAEKQRILQDPGLRVLRCVQEDRILFVPGALLGSTSHHVAEAARLIAERLDLWGSR